MVLIKNGAVMDDPYVRLHEDDPLDCQPAHQAIVVSLTRWQAERTLLCGRNAPVGVMIPPADNVDTIADDLPHIACVVLVLPVFSDGRAFSQARRLRERWHYGGEIRATGHIIRDQFVPLTRCGVDAIEVDGLRHPQDIDAALKEFTLFYQHVAGDHTPIWKLRHRTTPVTNHS